MKTTLSMLFAILIVGCAGGIGGPPDPPCGDKLKNWDGDNSPCSRGVTICPPKKRCLFDPSVGMWVVVDSTSR